MLHFFNKKFVLVINMNLYVYALVAAILFFILSPGTVLTLPPSSGCGPFIQLSSSKSCATSYTAVGLHALVFLIVLVGFVMWRKKKSSTNKYMYAIAAAVLFFVLTPGVVLTLPPSSGCGPFIQLNSSKSCATSYIAAAVHSLVFLFTLLYSSLFL